MVELRSENGQKMVRKGSELGQKKSLENGTVCIENLKWINFSPIVFMTDSNTCRILVEYFSNISRIFRESSRVFDRWTVSVFSQSDHSGFWISDQTEAAFSNFPSKKHMSSEINEITKKADHIEHIVSERLPRQRSILHAKLFAWRWLTRSIYEASKVQDQTAVVERLLQAVKQVKLEVGQFWYRAAEQSEQLTALLCDLDNILSQGNAEIREQRKAAILRIQNMISVADKVKYKGALLKEFAQDWFTPYIETLTAESESESETEMEDDRIEEEEEAMMKAEEEDEDQVPTENLPIWKPYYQVSQDNDAVYLRAALEGVNPKNISIHCDHDKNMGLVQIAGYKLPTAYDDENYGRFIIRERFPKRLVDFDTMEYFFTPDQVLEVRIPRRADPYSIHRPRSKLWPPQYYCPPLDVYV